ncbi:hypothetical protein LTR97_003854 [Elasticomyces elasticus]|uniref:Uncharacterized protein n=1 Tax=Elasticomyces elasticus TaxID=574655 RepID=A0AAN7W8J6_9PEZI|nr:hypothetical protein LTR97_003854 [Elasticomyces elasticus]
MYAFTGAGMADRPHQASSAKPNSIAATPTRSIMLIFRCSQPSSQMDDAEEWRIIRQRYCFGPLANYQHSAGVGGVAPLGESAWNGELLAPLSSVIDDVRDVDLDMQTPHQIIRSIEDILESPPPDLPLSHAARLLQEK